MDLGGGVLPTQGEALATEAASVAPAAGASSPLGTCSTSSTPITTPGSSQSANPLQPPSSLALGSPAPAQGPGTPISTTAPIGSRWMCSSVLLVAVGLSLMVLADFQVPQAFLPHPSARTLHPKPPYPGCR